MGRKKAATDTVSNVVPLMGEAPPNTRADAAGAAYANAVSVDHRKGYGLYLTPPDVAAFMARQIRTNDKTLRILDPAAGAGILLCAAVEALAARNKAPKQIELVAYEVDPALAEVLTAVLGDLQQWAAAQGIALTAQVVCKDFVLEHAQALRCIGGLFPHLQDDDAFDVVIANPPYFKLNKADPRAQAAAAVVHGQPNIYGLFMAIGAALLRDEGELIFITPRSFASGPYFRLFRETFFNCIRPELVHVFGSRRDAFGRDAVLQENVIIKGVRHDGWPQQEVHQVLAISSSQGVSDLDQAERRSVRLESVLNMASAEKVLRLPVNHVEDELMRLVDAWPGSLNAYGIKISTGPVVPFRARELLHKSGEVPTTHVPLLWMNHVHAMRVTWPIGRHKPEYIANEAADRRLLVPNANYVLLRRFSAKEEERRLVAGPYLANTLDRPTLGLENHLNYVYRPRTGLTDDETFGLAALFSSKLLDTYFRIINGNTQVSATELRTMPLPPLETVRAIGAEVRKSPRPGEAVENVVARHIGFNDQQRKVPALG